MIKYTEKGSALHEALRDAGLELWEHDGVHMTRPGMEEQAQAFIDGFGLDQARAPIIAIIKDLARQKILAFLPDWKQSNCNARMNELNMIRFGREWTAEEAGEIQALQQLWGRAEAIRNASNDHEAALNALESFDAVNSYDTEAGWPE